MVAHLEGKLGGWKRWKGDFLLHTILYLLNFELCEYITSIFKK